MENIGQTLEIYTQSEKFKYGFMAGFYDALPDDGMRYLDDILRYGARTFEEKDFMSGYRLGQRTRRGSLPYSSGPMFAVLVAAA